jgi:hypothetical protein
VALIIFGASLPLSHAQDADPDPFRLDGLVPSGTRASVTESWGTLRVDLTNFAPEGRDARVVAFYPERPDIQYARDVFVPGRSSVSSWLTVGPASEQRWMAHREVEVLLYDRTGGQERLVRPRGDERVRSYPLLYRRREVTVAVLPPDPAFDPPVPVESPDDPESVVLARTFREAASRSEHVSVITDRFLPPHPEAFEGIEVLVVASNRIATDPAALLGVRRWVEQGGTLWVLLDRVAPSAIAPLFGDGLDIRQVDRIGLTTTRLHRADDDPATAEPRDHDHPVEMARVAVGGAYTVLHTANGWPASAVRPLGRGRVLLTTLGARGWYRPRTARDPRSRFEPFPDQPVPLSALGDLAARFHPREVPQEAPAEALRDILIQEIGYTVVGRGTAAAILGGFVVALVGLGLGLRRTSHPELLGWLAPVAAAAAAATFLVIGETSRRAVPPTVGIAAVVDAVPESGDAAAAGVFAVYRPGAGPVSVSTEVGGMLHLDQSGLDGQTRQRVVTDADAWHWEKLNLPAGVRTGTFRSTIRTGRLGAVARFGPDGLDGRLDTGPFRGPADGLVLTPTRQPLPVRFGDGDSFVARGQDALPPGQYVAGAVLTDRQQGRQAVYRELLGGQFPKHWEGRNLLLTWADPGPPAFRVGADDRVVGMALLVLPLEFDRPPPDTPVTVPSAFVPYTRMVLGRPMTPNLEGNGPSELELRFQLPRSVLPLTVERVRLAVHARTPGRQFTVSGHGEVGLVPVFEANGPLDPVWVEIADPRLLRTDPEGGLRVTLKVGEQPREPAPKPAPAVKVPPPTKRAPRGKGAPAPGGAGDAPRVEQMPDLLWKIESVGMEVVGRTAANP